jgi:hypothetical protein
MVTPAGMVFGVLLEPGERVVYYHRDDPGWQKPLLIIVGLVMLVGVIGLFILIAGLMATTTVYVVTNRRFMIIEGKKGQKVSFIRHGQVKTVIRKLGGSIIKWLDLSDGVTTLAWQAAANPPTMPAVIMGFLDDPSSAERAMSVSHDNLAGPKSSP